jgi:hypothetical protein
MTALPPRCGCGQSGASSFTSAVAVVKRTRRRSSQAATHRPSQQLLEHVDVARGIAEAQQKHAEKCEITLDLLTEMTLEAYRAAMADGSAKGADVAVKAVAQLSRMHGFDVGKRPNERLPIEDLTADERDAVRRVVEEALEHARADNRLRKAS